MQKYLSISKGLLHEISTVKTVGATVLQSCDGRGGGVILGRYSREKFKFGKNVVKLILYIYK